MIINLSFKMSIDENDINKTSEEICELIESILYEGAAKNEVFIDEIVSIDKQEEE